MLTVLCRGCPEPGRFEDCSESVMVNQNVFDVGENETPWGRDYNIKPNRAGFLLHSMTYLVPSTTC